MANLPFTCRGCENRYPGCHSKCEKYKQERAEYDRLRAEHRKYITVKQYTAEQTSKNFDAHVKAKKSFAGHKWRRCSR